LGKRKLVFVKLMGNFIRHPIGPAVQLFQGADIRPGKTDKLFAQGQIFCY
jgi:hypothetical protein